MKANDKYLLLGNHNLEAVEIAQVAAGGALGNLLGSSSGSPLGINTRGLPSLLDDTSAGSTGNLNSKLGQVQAADADNLALHTSARSIDDNLQGKRIKVSVHKGNNPYSVMIDDLDDGGDLVQISTVVDQDNTTDFDKLGVHLQ